MKKGQNKNFQKDAFQTGLGGKVSYNKLIASLKDKNSDQKKALNVCRKGKRK